MLVSRAFADALPRPRVLLLPPPRGPETAQPPGRKKKRRQGLQAPVLLPPACPRSALPELCGMGRLQGRGLGGARAGDPEPDLRRSPLVVSPPLVRLFRPCYCLLQDTLLSNLHASSSLRLCPASPISTFSATPLFNQRFYNLLRPLSFFFKGRIFPSLELGAVLLQPPRCTATSFGHKVFTPL